MSRTGEAVGLLLAGDVIAFPTETVYGLGADAVNAGAVAKIFALKGRPPDHPLIVHIAGPGQLREWAREIPYSAFALAENFWPGPITMILKRSERVPDEVTGGQDTVGLRCPSHPIAQELLRDFARVGSGAIAAPSANRFGHVSPTTAEHVHDEFGANLFILDGGECEVGLESTIVDLSRGAPVLLRPGAVTREDIGRVIGTMPRDRDADAPRASGTLAAHYAPRTAMALVGVPALEIERGTLTNVAVLALHEAPFNTRVTSWIVGGDDPARYGHDLYANLRRLDASGAKRILVEAPPRTIEWEAVNDRLGRAAAGAGALPEDP